MRVSQLHEHCVIWDAISNRNLSHLVKGLLGNFD